ncbi:DNRLRE domain-containing protein [Listeria innocua]|uniref:DNRLRE domain-containing protein n=1 Tax=Listeria innocua TaxID=1642 RepID=UPI001624078C|nr:DNRLRE domain-containing protein [Listeria innocua]MBC1339369.1 DNRLRE domain-containing protein [Listeria innocua]
MKKDWKKVFILCIAFVTVLFSLPSIEGEAELSEKQENKVEDALPTEIKVERTENEAVYDNHDGSFTKKVYMEPVHLKENGVWKPISNEVTKTKDTIETERTELDAQFSTKIEGGLYSEFGEGKDQMRFYLLQASGENGVIPRQDVSASIPGENEVRYKDIFPQMDLRNLTFNTTVKEDIVLHTYAGYNQFTFQVKTSLSGKKEKDGSIAFYKTSGEKVYELPTPMMSDSKIHPETGDATTSDAVRWELSKTAENSYRILLIADESWLKSEEREYPIYIDPSVSLSKTIDANISSAKPTTNYSGNKLWDPALSAYSLKVGRYDDSTGFNYAYIKPDISTLANTTIESATFKVFAVWHHSSTAKNPVKLEEVTGDWTTSGVTWNTRPTTFNVGSVDIGRNQWANFDVTSSIRAWVTGARANKGFMLHTVNQQDHWKKFTAAETGGNIPYLEVKYTYNKPEKSVIKTKSNGAGTGSMNLTWGMVPGATGYKVIIGNGYNYEQFAVGNVTSWTTKGKGIFPTKAEIDKGLYTFHKDGKGEEFSNDPRALYENGYKAGSTFGLRNQTKYIVRIIATYPDGDSPSSDITEAYMPPETLPEKPEKPTIKTYSSGPETDTGYMDINWKSVPGAIDYKVVISNGYNYEYFQTGNITNWSTKGKKIFPTQEEIDNGEYVFHKDGKGEEFANDPRDLYENGYQSGSTFGLQDQEKYIVRVLAVYPWGDGISSDITPSYMPLATPAPPTGEAYANSKGLDNGYVTLSWDEVEGAEGYNITIFDGKKNIYFDVGEALSWTTKGVGIWPTLQEVKNGGWDIHTDGKGVELAQDPSMVYKNSNGVYGERKNYWFRVQAYTINGNRADSQISDVFRPIIPEEQVLSEYSNIDEIERFILDYLKQQGTPMEIGTEKYMRFVTNQLEKDSDSYLAQREDYLYICAYLTKYMEERERKLEIAENYSQLISPEVEKQREEDIEEVMTEESQKVIPFSFVEKDVLEANGLNESDVMKEVIEEYADYDKQISDAKDAELEAYLEDRDEISFNEEYTSRATITGIKHIKQNYKHWCGPANLTQALSFHASKIRYPYNTTKGQNNFGQLMGYNSKYGSTTSAQMARQMNMNKKFFKFSNTPYITGTIKEFGTGAANKVRTRLDGVITKKSNAPIVLVHQLYLKPYPARTSKALGHYLTVGGIRKSGGKYQAQLYNTQAGKQYHKVWWEDIGTGKGQNNTLTKAMYEKNLSSPNPVFVY